MRKILVLNSFSGIILVLITILLVFSTIPIFISKLGLELYGVYSLLLLVGNLNSFTNLGLNSALIKHISEQGKTEESHQDITISLILIISITTLVSFLGFVFKREILIDLLSIPMSYYNSDTLILYYFLILSNMIMMVGQIFVAVLDSLQKIFLTNILQLIYNILYWGLILITVLIWNNFALIGVSIFIAAIIWFLMVAFSFFKFWGILEFKSIHHNTNLIIKKNLGIGSKIYLSGVIGFFFEPISKILVSNYIGLPEVGIYDIIVKIKVQIWSLISKIFYPILPFLSAEKDFTKIRSIVHDIEQKLAFIILPIIVFFIFSITTLIEFWIGPNTQQISNGLIILISSYLISIILMPNYFFLTVKGYPEKTIVVQLSNVIINLLLFYLLLNKFLFNAIIYGNAGALLFSTLLLVFYQHKYLDSYIFEGASQFFKWLLLGSLLYLIGYLINSFTFIDSYKKLLILGLSIVTFFILFIRTFKILNRDDLKRYFGTGGWLYALLIKIFIK